MEAEGYLENKNKDCPYSMKGRHRRQKWHWTFETKKKLEWMWNANRQNESRKYRPGMFYHRNPWYVDHHGRIPFRCGCWRFVTSAPCRSSSAPCVFCRGWLAPGPGAAGDPDQSAIQPSSQPPPPPALSGRPGRW